MNFNGIKLPPLAYNPPMPNIVSKTLIEQEWHDEEIEKEEQKIALLMEQNDLLKEQNRVLIEANEENNKELKKSKRLNFFMALIAVLSLAATIVFGLLTLF